MPGPFGDHQLEIPYEPVADLLAKYARRDPGKTAIVDLESGTAIDFGQLDRIAIDIAAYLKSRGIGKGSRVLLLSDGNPGDAADLARRLAARRRGLPVQSRDEREADGDADGGARSRADRLSQGDRRCSRWSATAARRACASATGRRTARRTRRTNSSPRCRAATRRSLPERNEADGHRPASSAPRAPRRGRRSSSTTTPSIG